MNVYAEHSNNVLTINKLSKKFGSRFAVNQATWSATSGQIICLLGHSGCGKTTMLRLIAGMETPTSGSIQLEHNVFGMKNNISLQKPAILVWFFRTMHFFRT
jgi:iron(III) transport system ATP-binding protein